MYVWMHACMYVLGMYVWIDAWMHAYMHAFMFVCIYVDQPSCFLVLSSPQYLAATGTPYVFLIVLMICFWIFENWLVACVHM